MRKFVLLPIVALERCDQGQFMEIMSEPTRIGSIDLEALNHYGFDEAISIVKAVLKRLNYAPKNAKLYPTGYFSNINNPKCINLGLLLACFLQESACAYQKIIVTGHLDRFDATLSVLTTDYLEAKVKTLMKLGVQNSPTPFYFPKAMLTQNLSTHLAELEPLQIISKPIDSAFDVLVDFGIT